MNRETRKIIKISNLIGNDWYESLKIGKYNDGNFCSKGRQYNIKGIYNLIHSNNGDFIIDEATQIDIKEFEIGRAKKAERFKRKQRLEQKTQTI